VPIMQQGLTLMVIGMAVVFTFLVILIFVTKLLSGVVLKYFPEKTPPPKLAAQAAHPAAGVQAAAGERAGSEREIAAAIAAAVRMRSR
jgi:oxaloacetate decarboxylase (Na+ extruding) subunit gamma